MAQEAVQAWTHSGRCPSYDSDTHEGYKIDVVRKMARETRREAEAKVQAILDDECDGSATADHEARADGTKMVRRCER